MAILCKDINLLFVAYPRTGSSSIRTFLKEHYGGVNIGEHHGELKDASKYVKIDNLFKVAGVRNPYERTVSLYLRDRYKWYPEYLNGTPFPKWMSSKFIDRTINTCVNEISFNSWLSQKNIPKHDEILKDQYDKLIYFEDLQNQLDETLLLCGIKNKIALPHMQKGIKSKKCYTEYFSNKSYLRVKAQSRDYLNFTGYTFNGNIRNLPM